METDEFLLLEGFSNFCRHVFFWASPKPRVTLIWGFPKIRGTLAGGPYNKDYNILESILGSPYFGKLPYTPKQFQSMLGGNPYPPPQTSLGIPRKVYPQGTNATHAGSLSAFLELIPPSHLSETASGTD